MAKEVFRKSNTLGDYDLTVTSYGQQKVSQDYSLFNGLFTYDIPVQQ